MEASLNPDMPELINFLTNDGYEFKGVNYNPRTGSRSKALFYKMTNIDEINGNRVNDATITITVDFDTRFDYKNGVDDEKKGMIYDFNKFKAHNFIEKLMNGNYGEGKRKGNRRKTRKNRKTL
jgi:hypothetical protein